MEDEHVFSPYNPKNISIKVDDVKYILKSYGIPPIVHNFNIYQRAFCHTSYVRRPTEENIKNNIKLSNKPKGYINLKTKSNERLEFLGDGVLELIAKYYLYKRFPKANEGFMTEKKILLVKNEAIGKLADKMNLNKWMLISKHAEEKQIRNNLKKLGCLFEAFIGALFLDMNKITIADEEKWFEHVFSTGPGFQMAQKFVENIFEKHIDWTDIINNDDNFKNIVQVKIQKAFKKTPSYIEMSYNSVTGYKMGVYIGLGEYLDTNHKDAKMFDEFNSFDNINQYMSDPKNNSLLVCLGYGEHKIKKKAEQIACEYALSKLN